MLYIPRGTITATSPAVGTSSKGRSLHVTVRMHVLRAEEEALDVGITAAPLAKQMAAHSVGQTADRIISARSPVLNPKTGSDYLKPFWDKYIHAANELVLLDPDFRFSLDFSARNRSKEVLSPLYKQALSQVVDSGLIDGLGGLAAQESQAWFDFRKNQHMGTGRGREGVYKLEAAALAGLDEPELALRLYGEACQPMTCVQGVYPLHPSLAPHVSAPFPPRTPISPDEWQSEPWNGDFARSYNNALPPTLLSGLAQGLAQDSAFWKFQEKAHGEDGQFVSYWHDFKDDPTSLMDQAAQALLPLLPSYVSENAVGAEYWGYNQDLDKGGHAFHFDMDSPHRAKTTEWRFPIVTCIVFLSEAVGGPTLILDQSRKPGSPLAERGWLVRPDQPGTVYCFDSTLLHGVMPAFTEEHKTTKSGTTVRTSINIVYWAEECAHSNQYSMTCFERSLPIHRGKYTDGLPWEVDMPADPTITPMGKEGVDAFHLQEVSPIWSTATSESR